MVAHGCEESIGSGRAREEALQGSERRWRGVKRLDIGLGTHEKSGGAKGGAPFLTRPCRRRGRKGCAGAGLRLGQRSRLDVWQRPPYGRCRVNRLDAWVRRGARFVPL